MAKAHAVLEKSYPDMSGVFAARELARMERSNLPPTEKLRRVKRLGEINRLLKSAKIIKKGGVEKD